MYFIEKPIKWCKNKSFCLQWLPNKLNVYQMFDLNVRLLTDNKWFGIHLNLLGNIFSFDLCWTRRSDHAGFNFDLTILGQSFIFYTYDNRHWDDEKNDWEIAK